MNILIPKMFVEVRIALKFVKMILFHNRAINSLIPDHRLITFCDNLKEGLVGQCENNWYPSTPIIGSGSRLLYVNGYYFDKAILRAAEDVFTPQDLYSLFPFKLLLWIEPGEVSFKINQESPRVIFGMPIDILSRYPRKSAQDASSTELCEHVEKDMLCGFYGNNEDYFLTEYCKSSKIQSIEIVPKIPIPQKLAAPKETSPRQSDSVDSPPTSIIGVDYWSSQESLAELVEEFANVDYAMEFTLDFKNEVSEKSSKQVSFADEQPSTSATATAKKGLSPTISEEGECSMKFKLAVGDQAPTKSALKSRPQTIPKLAEQIRKRLY